MFTVHDMLRESFEHLDFKRGDCLAMAYAASELMDMPLYALFDENGKPVHVFASDGIDAVDFRGAIPFESVANGFGRNLTAGPISPEEAERNFGAYSDDEIDYAISVLETNL